MAKLSKKLKVMDVNKLVYHVAEGGSGSRAERKKHVVFTYNAKQKKPAKFSTREYTRCQICGRPHAVLKKYGICRICFRELAYRGEIPGVRKASW